MTEAEKKTRAKCDLITHRAAELMIEEGAGVGMMLDRLLTFSAAQTSKIEGAFKAATVFRGIADQIEAGAFAHVEPTDGGKGH